MGISITQGKPGGTVPDSGSLAEWLSAAAAVGALIIAVAAVYISWRSSTQLKTRQRQQQAVELNAWSISRPTQNGEDPVTRRGILVSNSSTSPVFDVVIESTYSPSKQTAPEALKAVTITVLPPGDFVVFRHSTYPWTFPRERTAEDRNVQAVMNNPGWRVTLLSFTDSQGVRWEREGGALREHR